MRVGNYEVYDVSALIGESLVTYPGDPKPVLKFVKRLAEGGSSNLSELCLGSHTGTHVDTPLEDILTMYEAAYHECYYGK